MPLNYKVKQYILRSYIWITMAGMTHGTEARYKEVITSVIGWRVFFNICKFDKLKKINNINTLPPFLKWTKHIYFHLLLVTLTSNVQIRSTYHKYHIHIQKEFLNKEL